MQSKNKIPLKVLSHKLKEVSVVNFFWLDDYEWCFDWYDNKEEEKAKCTTYGLFPQDFVEVNTNHEKQIAKFLEEQSKNHDIPVSQFFKWLNKNQTS